MGNLNLVLEQESVAIRDGGGWCLFCAFCVACGLTPTMAGAAAFVSWY